MMNTYEMEQAFTNVYGDSLMRQVAASFGCDNIERVTDKETQVKGVDYYIWKKSTTGRSIKNPVDIKIDYYDNENFAFELDQQYTGVGEKSWIEHDGNILIAYFKVAKKQVWIYKLSDLQDFMNSNLFNKRTTFETNRVVNGKKGHFKNFRYTELPLHHVVDVSLFYNPFTDDKTLLQTKSSLLDAVLYKDN